MIIISRILAFIFLTIVTSTAAAQSTRQQARALCSRLQSHQTISAAWQTTVTHEVTAAKDDPQFIRAICPPKTSCAQGAYSFSHEINGLSNLLAIDSDVIKKCYGQTMACISQQDKTRMFAETASQTHYELHAYLMR